MSESKAQIIISGDKKFNPGSLTKIINITPDVVWLIGDKIGSSVRIRNENAWILSTEYSNNGDVAKVLEKLLDKIKPVGQVIKDYIDSEKNIEMQASIAIYATDQVPALYFSPDLVARLSYFNASLDIDIMLIE